MWKLIVIVLLAVGAYFVYENQDELLTSATEKQRAIEDATNKALEY